MISKPYTLSISNSFNKEFLNKNVWLIILHASRTPPHIGILIDGNYNSLTIKGHELNINIHILDKLIQQKKIESIFIQLKKHPVFSTEYQKEICQIYIQQFKQVGSDEASCLNPVKLFLQEFYGLKEIKNELLFELIERLKQNNYTEIVMSCNLENKITNKEFTLPLYTNSELQNTIRKELEFYNKK